MLRCLRFASAAALAVTGGAALLGCNNVDCGAGTIERAGTCMPADVTVGDAKCGPFTMLEGDQCVPTLAPTVCDDSTTTPELDPATGVITCIGTGGGGCDATFACPAPTDATTQTICGQLFDLENGSKFRAPGALGTPCSASTTDGPCSLAIAAYDALAFGSNPQTAPKLATDPIYLDDCGRYRVPNIALPASPFIGLGIDDADPTKAGPMGTTNAIGVATGKAGGTATKDFDGYIATKATTDLWEGSGGPPVAGGIYLPIYRKAKADPTKPINRDLQDGVTFTRNGVAVPAQASYFTAAEVTRRTIDPAATATGVNGTALVTAATVADLLAYSGTGGLDATCQWEKHAGASLPFILFVQDFRPTNANGQTCDR